MQRAACANRSSTSKSTGSPKTRRSPRLRPTSTGCSTTCGQPSPIGDPCATRRARSRRTWPHAAAAPCGSARRRHRIPRVARGKPLHVPRLSMPRPRTHRRPGRTAYRRRHEPRHLAAARIARRRRRAELRRSAAASARVRPPARARRHHEVDVALDRAPSRLSRLHRRQAVRRCRRRMRRASLSRPLHAYGLQRQSGRHPSIAPQDGERGSPRRSSCRAAMRKSSSSTSSTTFRATSSFRSPRTICCARQPASCIWATDSASACSSAVIRSSASSRASSTRRASTTRPTCGRSGKRS